MAVGLARVTINTPRRRVDVALPEQVPVAELLPELLRHAGEGMADTGEEHGGWVLRRPDGAPLGAAQGLAAQGVRDGEVLHLAPARHEWPELEYDDVVEAIAAGARRRGAAWSAGATRRATLAVAAAPLAVGLFALLRDASGGGVAVALGAAAVLLLAGVVASRAYGDGRAGAALGGFALPYAFVGGALLLAGDPVGPLPPVPWLGAPQLLVGTTALSLVAVLGAVGVAAGLRVFAAGVTVGVLGGAAALTGYAWGGAGAAAVLAAVLVCGVGAAPVLAIRFGKLPLPPVDVPDASTRAGRAAPGDPVRERPDRDLVFAAVARTEELLTGALIGVAVLAAAGVLVLALDGGVAGGLLAAVTALALLLRSRLFVTARQRLPLLIVGVSALAVLAGTLVAGAGAGWSPLAAGIGVLVALVVAAAGGAWANRPPSPYLGRAVDVLDTLAVVSVVPIAAAVLGLYAKVRGLAG